MGINETGKFVSVRSTLLWGCLRNRKRKKQGWMGKQIEKIKGSFFVSQRFVLEIRVMSASLTSEHFGVFLTDTELIIKVRTGTEREETK